MSSKHEKLIPGQIAWNLSSGETFVSKTLAELPIARKDYSNLEIRDFYSAKRIAYLKEDTVRVLMDRTKFSGKETDFLKTLVIFPQGTKIIFDKRDRETNKLISPTIAHEVKPIDDWDVPIGCKWYQVISTFIDNDKKIDRKCVYYQSNNIDHPSALAVKNYFFANPNHIASSAVYLSRFSKNGWGKK